MLALLDTSFLYALADASDRHHQRRRERREQNKFR